MKVLWFANTPSRAAQDFGFYYKGGGWIEALEAAVLEYTDWQLAIAFHINSSEGRIIEKERVIYYPITNQSSNTFGKWYKYMTHTVDTKYDLYQYLKVINIFQPDIIQIFGTESGFGRIIPYCEIPVCIHLQGIMTEIIKFALPPGINYCDILRSSPVIGLINGTGFVHDYFRNKRAAERESQILKACRYVMGRTDWDHLFVKSNAKSATYFHCEELMRSEFQNTVWRKPGNNRLVLITTNNGEIYKGIDIVLKTATMLKKENIDFEWRVAGIDKYNFSLKVFENKFRIDHKKCNIKLLGALATKDLIKEMLKADLFIHPSRIDNSPNSVCEAMLIGMPVIAANVGGIPSLIDNGINGWLFDPDDNCLFDSIKRITDNSQTISHVARNARETSLKRHNVQNVTNNLSDIYRFMLNDHAL